MKREIIAALLLALCLAGCSNAEDPYRVDTVVYIPADPTEAATEAPAEVPTEAPVEAAASEESAAPEQTEDTSTKPEEATETEPEATEAAKKTTSTKKSSGGKKTTSSSKKTTSSSKKDTAAKATEPPATKPAVTEPSATEPPATEAPATEPPATEPPATEPPATEPPATEPPAKEPPATETPVTESPATEPEPTDPPLYDISGYSVGSLEQTMATAINAHRTEAGLGELSLSSRLCAIASCRGYEISQVWSHTRPDGRSYGTVLGDYGYGGGKVRELLVYVSGSGDGVAIVDKWMGSDSHKELLLGDFSTVGVGVYRANGYTYIACLLVG